MKDLQKYIKKLSLGKGKEKVILENNILIAPMAGVTDRAFREVIYDASPIGLIFNEMVSAKALIYNDEKTWDMLKPFEGEEERVRGIQLFGSNPEDFEKAVKLIKESENINVDIIDINMGCPAPKIIKSGSGCMLLKDLDNIKKIAESVRNVWDKVLSFKIRIGLDEENIIAYEVCDILEKAGADFITIHARTYEGMFDAPVNYEVIKNIKDKLNIPVIFNGGIFTPEDALKAFEKTNADGIMLARGAIENPYLGRDMVKIVDNNKDDLINLIKKHFELNIKYLGEVKGSKEFRKYLIWYSKLFKRSNVLRSRIGELVDEKSFEGFLKEINQLELK